MKAERNDDKTENVVDGPWQNLAGVGKGLTEAAGKLIEKLSPAGAVIVFIVAILCVTAIVLVSIFVGHGDDGARAANQSSSKPSASQSAKATKSPDSGGSAGVAYRVGGVDLAGYCSDHGFVSNSVSDKRCQAPIDLDKACSFDRGKPGLHAKFTGPGPYTVICYDGKTALKGIGGMADYCASVLGKAVRPLALDAKPIDNRHWYCMASVHFTDVCAAQWSHAAFAASAVGSKDDWSCFVGDPTTLTPQYKAEEDG